MKKIILTILLASAIWSCEKKESPIIDNTKELQNKIDSLTIARSRVDTVFVLQKKRIVKIIEKNISQEKEAYCDFLKNENAMLVEQLCILEQEKVK